MGSSDLKQKLRERAQLAVFSNRISEFHEKNLKMYPFVVFDGIAGLRIDYDLGHGLDEKKKEVHHNSRVSYRLSFKEGFEQKDLQKRCTFLERAVRDLLWKDVKVEIYFDNNKVYESKDV